VLALIQFLFLVQLLKKFFFKRDDSGKRLVKENDERVNLAKIYCKHFCKCHDVHPVPQYDDKIKI
jgi:hypothetical protein